MFDVACLDARQACGGRILLVALVLRQLRRQRHRRRRVAGLEAQAARAAGAPARRDEVGVALWRRVRQAPAAKQGNVGSCRV